MKKDSARAEKCVKLPCNRTEFHPGPKSERFRRHFDSPDTLRVQFHIWRQG